MPVRATEIFFSHLNQHEQQNRPPRNTTWSATFVSSRVLKNAVWENWWERWQMWNRCETLASPVDIWRMTGDLSWWLRISCTLKLNSFKSRKTSFRWLGEFYFIFTQFIYDFFNGFGSWPKSPWPPWLFGVWRWPVTRDCRIDRNGTVWQGPQSYWREPQTPQGIPGTHWVVRACSKDMGSYPSLYHLLSIT